MCGGLYMVGGMFVPLVCEIYNKKIVKGFCFTFVFYSLR
jgi:hypothetical protein